MEELGPDEQRWLDVLRAADEPEDADRARVRASVLAVVAGASAGAATATATAVGGGALAKSTTSAGGALAGWKIVAAVVSVLAVGGGGTALLLRDSIVPPRPGLTTTAVSASATVARLATSEETTLAETDAGVIAQMAVPEEPSKVAAEPPSRGRVFGRPNSSKAHPDDVDAELVLLTEAQQALKRGDPNAALVALTRHGREHPHGTLAVERDGLRAIASCEAKRGDGRALAERFVTRNASSPLVARVRTACLSP
jgi:hypothetical protein